jgi:hypothetical protein
MVLIKNIINGMPTYYVDKDVPDVEESKLSNTLVICDMLFGIIPTEN